MFSIYSRHKTFDSELKLSRKEARAAGVVVFWTGRRCANGHMAHRYVSNGNCTRCQLAARQRSVKREATGALGSCGIDMDIRRKIENAQIDALTVVDDWDY